MLPLPSGPSGYIPTALRLPETLPHFQYLRDIVRSLCEHRPFHRLPGDAASSATATAPLTAYLRDADHPTYFLNPPINRTQTTDGLSAFLDDTTMDDLSNPSSPALMHLGFGLHRFSLVHFGSSPRPTISQSVLFCVVLPIGETLLFANRIFRRQ